ncbi:CU044_5270 family protein [Planotetraspora sp. A-T 1434]|uniref:CU044_5270 family protein n=1 Tax=Planotetraspora sp. A-T 1434 TaxID=2979219 RepID=UPI0021BFB38F|nr:CU044_5270 family protein [Planotetraspora sp. A-T 1434]MCT9932940.1 CU044_5270 family protein [Planotetraspora sp. A-T 1434]
MNDEIDMISQARPEAAPYSVTAKMAARRGLTGASAPARRRKPYGIAFAGVATAAAAGVVAVGVLAPAPHTGTQGIGSQATGSHGTGGSGSAVVALPKISKMSAVEVLGKAARAVTDLSPRDDQFIKVTSQTMYGAFGGGMADVKTGETDKETRYLYRSKRTIWLSADGTRDGALKREFLDPKAYPGWPIPKAAYAEQGVEWDKLPACPTVPDTAYIELKKLPTGPDGMRAYLYSKKGSASPDDAAWTAVGDLLRETYMPAAQRAALFKAAGTIPGVTVSEDAEDAAGRRGIGVGRVSNGVREDIIFDPKTYELLGERGVVVDEKEAKSPVGSLVASTAQLEVSVDDTAPKVDDPAAGCA